VRTGRPGRVRGPARSVTGRGQLAWPEGLLVSLHHARRELVQPYACVPFPALHQSADDKRGDPVRQPKCVIQQHSCSAASTSVVSTNGSEVQTSTRVLGLPTTGATQFPDSLSCVPGQFDHSDFAATWSLTWPRRAFGRARAALQRPAIGQKSVPRRRAPRNPNLTRVSPLGPECLPVPGL